MNTIISKDIIEQYNLGLSINQIAKNFNISWDTVKRILVKNNITIISKRNQFQINSAVSDHLFQEIDSHESAYWLGFLYADGSVRSGNRNEIALELNEQDKLTVEAFHKFCDNKNAIREHIITRQGRQYISYVSSFSNKQVKEHLIRLGCVPKKSLILTAPSSQQVSDLFFTDFVRGYFDGDGYCRYDILNHKYDIVILGTESFLTGVAKRLNITNICTIKKTNTNIYSLTIYKKENVYYFLKLIYDNNYIALERKKQKFLIAQSGLQ